MTTRLSARSRKPAATNAQPRGLGKGTGFDVGSGTILPRSYTGRSHAFQWCVAPTSRRPSAPALVVGNEFLRDTERVGCSYFYIRRDPGTLPVGLGDGVDGGCIGNSYGEVTVDPTGASHVRTACGCLAHKRGALQHLQVVAELLRPGKSRMGDQHVGGLVSELVPN